MRVRRRRTAANTKTNDVLESSEGGFFIKSLLLWGENGATGIASILDGAVCCKESESRFVSRFFAEVCCEGRRRGNNLCFFHAPVAQEKSEQKRTSVTGELPPHPR